MATNPDWTGDFNQVSETPIAIPSIAVRLRQCCTAAAILGGTWGMAGVVLAVSILRDHESLTRLWKWDDPQQTVSAGFFLFLVLAGPFALKIEAVIRQGNESRALLQAVLTKLSESNLRNEHLAALYSDSQAANLLHNQALRQENERLRAVQDEQVRVLQKDNDRLRADYRRILMKLETTVKQILAVQPAARSEPADRLGPVVACDHFATGRESKIN